jgi:2-polyprenyl-3-methyl-5-hydroxy-6-metoxy-1,4-benzoquinol methylase
MSFAYELLYGVGFTPWEQMAESRLITEQISALFDREEAGREPPHGRALDLGCGSGNWAVKLAARGWEVTGVDFVPKALRRARSGASREDIEAAFPEWKVTDEEAMDVSGAPRYVRSAHPRFYRLRRS